MQTFTDNKPAVPAVLQEQATPEAAQTKLPRRESAGRARRPRVVVIGSGFGGLNAARKLGSTGVDVLVVDRNNYHGFWPLLYQVATAGIEPESIAYPVRAIFHKHRNVGFRMAQVESIDANKRVIRTDSGSPITYNYLIVAAGSANNYFGNNALADQTYGLKDIGDAERLRNQVLSSFEQAVGETDPDRRRALLTFVIVGGGPTGVELSGAFSELIHHALDKDYPMLDMSKVRVVLVEATDHILATFPESLQESAKRKLAKMDVELKLHSPVASVEGECVTFADGTQLEAGTVVWAAGVRASTLADTLGAEQGRNARVKVTPTLNLPGHTDVFVVGDMAYLEGYKGNQAYPMVAQTAIQQGTQAAENILRQVQGKPMKPFHYFDHGNMATIGRRSAVLDAFGVHLNGRLAWFGWLFIHLIYLIGFRNRLIVLINWAFNYFTFERGVRLITGKGKRTRDKG